MMDFVYILAALIGVGASFTTFCLMRFPKTRRPRFQSYGPFSFPASFFGALTILFVSVLLAYVQVVWS